MSALVDPFGRHITYLRVSVTDRCDLRCIYCMNERMRFLPKAEVLSFEEIDRLSAAFIKRGVRKLRLTGGEPLLRRDFMDLARTLSRHIRTGSLDELTLTTNATRLSHYAADLAAIGVKRINVSLDTLDPEAFARITHKQKLSEVLEGVEAAHRAGIAIKINTVALKRDNARELPSLVAWAHERGMDITLIEAMPLGAVDEDRTDQFLSLAQVRRTLEQMWTLEPLPYRSGGPAHYVRVRETGGRLGFITPLSHNFCAQCNRVRLTCTGRLYMCLGQDDHIDFRDALRAGASDHELDALIARAMRQKPEAHNFSIGEAGATPALSRHMSVTGG